jgi:hypothetical protein
MRPPAPVNYSALVCAAPIRASALAAKSSDGVGRDIDPDEA